MTGHVEREFKLELPDEEALARLRRSFGRAPARTARQVNHFFDTSERALGVAKIALRLREEEARWSLTLKGPRTSAKGALAARAEEEFELDSITARRVLEGLQCPLVLFERGPSAGAVLVRTARVQAGTGALAHLGAFTNERTRLGPLTLGRGANKLVLELDRTHYPDGSVACELELEVPAGIAPEALERGLRALFARLELPWKAAENKAARFFRALARRPG